MLSSIQKQFLINSTIFGASAAYNVASLVRFNGFIDEERLRDAWERVFAATEILRFPATGAEGTSFPIPGPRAPWELVVCGEERVLPLATAAADRPFDLDEPPLARFVVYRSADRHHLLIVLHHIVTDLFSKNLLATHLARAYADPAFVPSMVPYSEFRDAERSYLNSDAGAKARAFWKAKMERDFEPLRLPAARRGQRSFSGTGRRLPWALDENLRAPFDALEETGRVPFLVLLTAYACLLSRISGQRRFLVGVPMTNRFAFGDAPLSGPCVNILPVVCETEPGDAFADVYARIRREMLENHRHQGFPLVEVARLAKPEPRDPLRPRLLQAGFTREDPMPLSIPGVECSHIDLSRSGAQMDLFFTWWKDGDSWRGYWEYNDASFGEEDVRIWQTAFRAVLDAVLRTPDAAVSSLDLVAEDDRRRLTGEGAEVSYPIGLGMDALLSASYSRHGNETAMVYRGKETSYADFAAGVSRFAAAVRRRCGSGKRVAVLLDRSPEMLYALHGIVHSGNAYVPLGIDWPAARVADILEDIAPALVVTQREYRDRIPGSAYPAAIASELLTASDPAPNPTEGSAGPDSSMYILYTSGSTGKPKGAELLHKGIVNRLLWMQDEYRLLPGQRCLLKTPYTFDVSGWELFWPFLAGATLVVAEESAHRDPREILDLIRKEDVRIVHFVPTMLSHFLDQEDVGSAAGLSDVVCSGEALTPELVTRFFARLPGARLHNLYGPTEASIDVTFWECSRADVERGTVPIGRPIANTQVYVLDEGGKLCPPLVRGEIFLGGIGLAKGYWNRPELTRERFVENPYGQGKLYRTGDWGRYGLDGAIEYLERMDAQVKIRGMRVELGEIETALRSVPGIENAVVKKGKTAAGAECLIAYYVSRTGVDVPNSEITALLRDRIPEAIVPEHFVRLPAFPVSGSGKADRNSLPDRAEAGQAASGAARRPPANSTEALVADLWAEVLGSPVAGADVAFFDAGGNSLLILALRAKLEKAFGLSVKIADLFRSPTVSGMAALFRRGAQPSERQGGMDSEERARRQRSGMSGLAARKRNAT